MNNLLYFGLSVNAWITVVIILGVFLTLLFSKVKPHVAFFVAIALLDITGVLSIEEAFGGLDTASIITVGLLFLVIAGLRYTGALEWMVSHLMGQPKNHARAIIRLMIPVGTLSSFMSNTATTALFQDVIKKWSDKLGMAPSKLLIPLAYAASLGGLLTLIGTPPNLIIAGMYAKDSGSTLNVFAPFPVAICCLLVSVVVIILLRKLLPTREAPKGENTEENTALNNVKPTYKTFLSLGIMISVLLLSSLNVLSLPTCCFLAGIAVVLTGCCTSDQAAKEVDWNIIMVFAGSFAMGTAIHKTGIDQFILNSIFNHCGTHPLLVLVTICLVASITTEFISDTACAAMFCPIALEAAHNLHVSPVPFAIALMMSVSNNYATPIATPPNTLVYGSGGYKFGDFARLGLLLKVINLAIAVSVTTFFYPL